MKPCLLRHRNGAVTPATNFTVETGVVAYSLSKSTNDSSEQVPYCGRNFAVQSVTVNPYWNFTTGDNDVAILHLVKSIDLSQHCVCSLCVVNKEPKIGETCATSGFGLLNSTGKDS